MCRHPPKAKHVRYIQVRNYRVRNVVCRMCHNRGQRERRAVRNAFRLLARLPVLA